jgi:hypothetical protein
MSSTSYAILLVKSTSHALRGEKVLHETGMKCKLIPVPRMISSDCGVCVRVLQAEGEKARQALADAGVEVLVVVNM